MAHSPRIVAHGGVGAPSDWSDGCEAAVDAARRVLADGGDALAAAVAAVVRLEDDGRFNAGRGSALRLDGETIEMDAAVATSDGRIGAVAAIREVRNPVLVAERVLETPHLLLAGEGATRFARRKGFGPFREVQELRRKRWERAIRKVASREGRDDLARWNDVRPEDVWNFPGEIPVPRGTDTVGAVVRDDRGRLAVASSTGGTTMMLLGRVGDTPLPGCGFMASPAAAVAPTGVGETIVARFAALRVHDRIAAGEDPAAACEASVAAFPDAIPYGVIAIGPEGSGVAHNRDMPWAEGGV
jgi:isoaspartyl peptidase/L-asparaginase-like protein (Ntn-hydrolase superfamily)